MGARRAGELRESFDEFEDLLDCSHAESAARIRADGVDILVDLKGYTTDARPEILALRPAPVQVNYLGYPGTMGSDAVDYVLVDPVVVPADEQPYFTERLVHLPDCYQVNDRRRPIAPRMPARPECGLPEDGVRVLLLQLRIQDHGADVRYLDAAAGRCAGKRVVAARAERDGDGESAARGGIADSPEGPRGWCSRRRCRIRNTWPASRSPTCFSTRFLTTHIRSPAMRFGADAR